MIRRVLTALAAICTIAAAQAQDTPPVSQVGVWTARFAQMTEACNADPNGAACVVAVQAVQADLAAALTAISYLEDRATARDAVRKALLLDAPGVQTAAAYALARLGPEPQDTPALLTLLNDRIPTLRRAAWGALNASADPAAREWAARAKWQLVGERFIDDVRPTDAATLGVELPPGSVPAWFEVTAWKYGAQVFTADGAPGDVITYFSSIAGRGSVPLAEAADLFKADPNTEKSLERFVNAAWYQSPYVVVLDEGVAGDETKPGRLAVIWYDVQLGKTGFALQWLPAGAMPRANDTPWSGYTPLPKTLAGIDIATEPANDESWIKPDAKDFDSEAFALARGGSIAEAEAYLDLFPEGAYRAEAEALKTRPWVRPAEADLVEPKDVRISFANLPADQPIRFDIVSDEMTDANASNASPEAPQPDRPVSAPPGQASGEVVWASDDLLKPGLYAIRVFFGEDKMNFDDLALARMLPGEEPQLYGYFRVLPRMVQVALDKPIYNADEPIRITYKGMAQPGTDNAGAPFFTVVAKGAKDDDWGQYVYTKDQTDGTVILAAPSTPGDYEVRALFQQDAIVRGVAEFTVDPARATAPIPTPTPEPTPAPTPVPEDMKIVITLDKPSFAPGEAITGKVTGLSGDRDWIAVVPAGAEDGTTGKWVYAGTNLKEATFTLEGQPAGAYEIRVRFHDQYRPVQRRLAFEVK